MVRKVRLGGPRDFFPVGTIGMITSPRIRRYCVNYEKVYFAYSTDVIDANGIPWGPSENTIEPVYDGDQPVSWEGCAWKPQTIRV